MNARAAELSLPTFSVAEKMILAPSGSMSEGWVKCWTRS